MLCNHHFCLVSEHSHHSKRTPPPLSPWQPVIRFLTPWIYLFWTVHRNEVIQYVAFCVWFLSLGITFSRFIQIVACINKNESHSVMTDSLQPHGLYSPWHSPGQNTGMGSLSLLQGIFPTQGLNLCLLHCRWFFTS